MTTLLLILTLFAPVNLQEKVNIFLMRETVTVLRNSTRVGWFLESEMLSTKWVLKIQCRRGIAEKIDFQRYYFAIQRLIDFRIARRNTTVRYNLNMKFYELDNEIPLGIPRRIRLEDTGWGLLFQY